MNRKEKKAILASATSEISLSRRAELLDISRTNFYYRPSIDEEDKRAMDAMDEIYTAHPYYGSRRMKPELQEKYGIDIGRHHIRRLMREMSLEAIYPKPKTSVSSPEHKKYPYLLNDIHASFPNHIWGTDITYIRLEFGWAYLIAFLDWFSRYVIAWELSLSLETDFCITALNRALEIAHPKIHNSDQGVQFTSTGYTGILEESDIEISMDGRGRCMDNIFTERLWRTVKYEDVYLKSYRNIGEAREGLSEYFTFYNTERRHQSLDYRTPEKMYFEKN